MTTTIKDIPRDISLIFNRDDHYLWRYFTSDGEDDVHYNIDDYYGVIRQDNFNLMICEQKTRTVRSWIIVTRYLTLRRTWQILFTKTEMNNNKSFNVGILDQLTVKWKIRDNPPRDCNNKNQTIKHIIPNDYPIGRSFIVK